MLIVFLVGNALCAVEHRVDDAVVIFHFGDFFGCDDAIGVRRGSSVPGICVGKSAPRTEKYAQRERIEWQKKPRGGREAKFWCA